MTLSPRVQPELMTDRKSSLWINTLSASSRTKDGAHFSIERNSAGPLIETLGTERHARKLTTLSSVVLPLSFSGEVTKRIGECVTTSSYSCSHVNMIHSATAIT